MTEEETMHADEDRRILRDIKWDVKIMKFAIMLMLGIIIGTISARM